MPKGVPRDGSRKSPKERAPKWPADPHVTELVVAKTVEVLKMPEVGGNPWQSRKLAETFRIVHEQLLSGRDKALFYPLGEDSMPLTAGQMLRQVDEELLQMEAKVIVSGGVLTSFASAYEEKLYGLYLAYKTPRDAAASSGRKSGPKISKPRVRTPHETAILAGLPAGRLVGQHSIDTHPKARSNLRLPCAMCEAVSNMTRLTRYWCTTCKKSLHADGCFRQWHSNNPDLSETHQRREQRSNNRRKRARSHSPDEHDAG